MPPGNNAENPSKSGNANNNESLNRPKRKSADGRKLMEICGRKRERALTDMAVIESPVCRKHSGLSGTRFALSLLMLIVMENACATNRFVIDDQPASGRPS
jgi:hypothetical protein